MSNVRYPLGRRAGQESTHLSCAPEETPRADPSAAHPSREYRGALVAVVLLQLVQTSATLYLPSLNAHIIDKGVLLNNRGYIYRTGLLMLGVTLVQILFATCAVYFGARMAMGFGRDVRHNLFHQVTGYSAREVNQFGPSSLITRITNDVQQVQMLVVMGATMLVAAPLTMIGGVFMALREDVGLSAMLLVSVPALVIAVGFVVVRMVPQFRVMQTRIDSVNRILREQIIGIRVVRAFVREPDEVERFDRQRGPHRDLAARWSPPGAHVPHGHARAQHLDGRRGVDRRQSHQQRATCKSASWSPSSPISCRSSCR